VDFTVGFDSIESGLEVRVHQPVAFASLHEEDLRLRFP
jgi:hypothetical protein